MVIGMGYFQAACWLAAALLVTKVQTVLTACSSGESCVTDVSPQEIGQNGAVRITISGKGFSKDKFSYGSGNEHRGNLVTLVSGVRSYVCDIHLDGNTYHQITCNTRPMVPDTYYVRVVVDGEKFPETAHCGGVKSSDCSISVLEKYTPTISKITRRSGVPGDNICVYGKLFTDVYGSNVESATNSKTQKITRVWINGHNPCNLKDESVDEFYKLKLDAWNSDMGELCCKPDSTYIYGWNVSFIVDGKYGTSKIKSSILGVNKNDDLEMYQTYAVVSKVSPSEGSIVGGTKLVITGEYFDDTDEDVKVHIGGVPCEDPKIESKTQISCYTPVKPQAINNYGSRGIVVDMWNTAGIDKKTDEEISNLSDAPVSTWADQGSWKKDNTGGPFAARAKLYFQVPKDSDYKFYLLSADYAALYMSTTGKPDEKTLIGKNEKEHLTVDSDTAQSDRITLKKGNILYLEVIHKGPGPKASIELAVHIYQSQYTAAQTFHGWNEQFKIKTTSPRINEIQTVKLESPKTDESFTAEVQEFVVEVDNASRYFHLELYGVRTVPILFLDVDTYLEAAINNLPFFSKDDKASATIEELSPYEKKFIITLPKSKGDYPDIKVYWANGNNTGTSLSAFKETKGIAEGSTKLQFMMGNAISTEVDIKNGDVKDKLTEAVNSIFRVGCPKYIANPLHYSKRISEFETSDKATNKIVPFCGQRSIELDEVEYLVKSKYMETIKGTYSKLCFAFRGVIKDKIYVEYDDINGKLQKKTIDYAFKNFMDPSYYPEVVTDDDPDVEETWRYRCICLKSLLKDEIKKFFQVKIFKKNIYRPVYIDSVYMSDILPTFTNKDLDPDRLPYGHSSERINSLILSERMIPEKWLKEKVTVKSMGDNKYSVELQILDCHHDLPYFSVMNAKEESFDAFSGFTMSFLKKEKTYVWPNMDGMKVIVEKTQEASPPLSGTLDLKLGAYKLKAFQVNADNETLSAKIKNLNLKEFGDIKVIRSGKCFAYDWDVEYITKPGDHPDVELTEYDLKPAGAQASLDDSKKQDGGLFQKPIPGDVLATGHNTPQVVVDINGFPTKCTGTCDFTWSDAGTPKITNVSPTSGSKADNTVLTITGQGFATSEINKNNNNNIVTIGGVDCDVQSSSEFKITCSVGEGPAGQHKVHVRVEGYGEAAHKTGTFNFEYSAKVDSIEGLDTGYLNGGAEIIVKGTGFTEKSEVKVDGKTCETVNSDYTSITCIVPKGDSVGSKSVTVTDDGKAVSGSASFTYETASASMLTYKGDNTGKVEGGETITISGSGFGADKKEVMFGNNKMKVKSWSDSSITVELHGLKQGVYNIRVKMGEKGYANGVGTITYTFEVTDVYPTDGSLAGGTKITIKGKGFSKTEENNEIMFCGTPCKVKTASNTRIFCELGYAGKTHTITNDGVHKDYGKGFAWFPDYLIVEEGDRLLFNWSVAEGATDDVGFRVFQTKNLSSIREVKGGFNSGPLKIKTGEWMYQVSGPKTYTYTSGAIDPNGLITSHGQFVVKKKEDVAKYLKFIINGFEAEYKLKAGIPDRLLNPQEYNDPCVKNTLPSCGIMKTNEDLEDKKFKFGIRECLTPTISAISPAVVTAGTPITITGTGFNSGCNKPKVYIEKEYFNREVECIVNKDLLNDERIVCSITTACSIPVGLYLKVDVLIENRGFAIHTQNNKTARAVIVIPGVKEIFPEKGGSSGGTNITITGSNFMMSDPPCPKLLLPLRKRRSLLKDVKMLNGGKTASFQLGACSNIAIISPTKMICTTTEVHEKLVSTTRQIIPILSAPDGRTFAPECVSECEFVQSAQYGPKITEVKTPLEIMPNVVVDEKIAKNGIKEKDQVLKILGEKFGTSKDDITVYIGNEKCTVTDVTDTRITCTVGSVVHGSQLFTVHRKETILSSGVSGYASFVGSEITLQVHGSVSRVTPSTVGNGGCANIILKGFGFHPLNSTVTVGDHKCNISELSTTTIKCKVSSIPDGEYDVKVDILGEKLNTKKLTVSRSVTPTLTSVAPNKGSAETEITVSGKNFGTDPSLVKVTIDNVPCTDVTVTDTSITCKTGDHHGGTFDVEVVVEGRGCAVGTAQFEYELKITDITPYEGSTGGSQTITLTGQGFNTDSSVVMICDAECEVDYSNITSTQLICITPPTSKGTPSKCDVSIDIGDGVKVTEVNGYTYTQGPTITGVSPKRGGTGGGTRITVEGTGFGSDVNDVTVTIAGTKCEIDTFTATSIECTTNEHKPAVKSQVVVTNKVNGKAEQIAADFEYIDLWSKKYTWGGTSLPKEGDLVHIPADMTVVLDVSTPVFKVLLIEGNVIVENDPSIDIKLMSEIIFINGGSLQVGTEAEPFEGKLIIELHGHVTSKDLPIYGTKCISLREGQLELHGKPIVNTWTVLDGTVEAGVDVITVQDDISDWKVGDEIVIATTSHRHSQSESEQHVIKAKSGKTITLKTPLSYKHMGEDFKYDTRILAARAEVGLLSRNVVVRGNRNKEWDYKIEKCEAGFNTGQFATQTCFEGRFGEELGSDQYGAHILIHKQDPNKDTVQVHIENIELSFVGQAFRLGRYAIHLHINGDMTGSYVKNTAIHHSFNRAINIHATHNFQVIKNVAYNIKGGAFFLEDGIETGSIFEGNLAVFVKQSTSLQNDDITPAAFWATNPNNTFRSNHAAGGTHFGFWYRMHSHPDGPSFTKDYCPRNMPLGIFEDNVVHSQGWFGIWVFMSWFPTICASSGCCKYLGPKPAKLRSLTAWNCEKGAETVVTGSVQMIDFFMVNNAKAGIEGKQNKGPMAYYNENNGPLVSDGMIVAREPKLDLWKKDNGHVSAIVLPISPGFMVKRMTYFGFNIPKSSIFSIAGITGSTSANAGGHTYYVSEQTLISSTKLVNFGWMHHGVIIDEDGTLTGEAPGTVIVPKMGGLPPDDCVEKPEVSVDYKGLVCKPSVKLHRFAFNEFFPMSSVGDKSWLFTNQYGTIEAFYADKDLSFGKGWRVLLLSGENYKMELETHHKFTNISYYGRMDNLGPDDHITINFTLSQRIDRISLDQSGNKSLAGLDASNDNNLDFSVTDRPYGDFDKVYDAVVLFSGNRPNPSYKWSNRFDSSINLYIYRCYYTPECKPPPDPSTLPPPTASPDDAINWHDSASWKKDENGGARAIRVKDITDADKPLGNLPPRGMDLEIKGGTWVRIDRETPKQELGILNVYGTLEIEALVSKTRSLRRKRSASDPVSIILSFETIVIRGGRIFVGWDHQPMENNVVIEIRGGIHSPEVTVSSGPPIGAKAIAVFGGLEVHGKPVKHTWLRLKQTADAGSKDIYLTENPEWKAGDEIVITATGFNPIETEKRTITSTTGNRITVDKPLYYKHLGGISDLGDVKEMHMSAEVGLLTRNVKIKGVDFELNGLPGGMEEKKFGGRILVSTDGITLGYARIKNAEFKFMGQEGYVDKYDPRFALSYVALDDVDSRLRPSHVTDCTFHELYNSAIGVFATNKLNITNNVIYKAYSSGIVIESSSTRVTKNLISRVVCPVDKAPFEWYAAVETQNSHDAVFEDNVVSGYDLSGYRIDGEICGRTPQWKNNQAHSGVIGVIMLPGDGLEPCASVNNFLIWRNFNFGMYLQTTSIIEAHNNVLVENRVGFLGLIYGESEAGKSLLVQGGYFVGQTSDCAKRSLNDGLTKLIKTSKSWNTNGKGMTGLVFGAFTTGSNKAPRKPFANIMSRQTIRGRTTVIDVTFTKYGKACGDVNYAITTPPFDDDGVHPMYMKNVKAIDIEQPFKIFYNEPNVGKVNPSDCVDMECDGLKQVFLTDKDGFFLGKKGSSAVPMSEKNWNGDKRRGIGDYRLPREMFSGINGQKMNIKEVASKRGIVKNSSCKLYGESNTWHCSEKIIYCLLNVKSMDKDWMTRRLSPIAFQGPIPKDDIGPECKDCYVDLVNGPQDHGWCAGYTCQKRASLFPIVVPGNGSTYNIFYTSNAPQHTKLYWLTDDLEASAVLGFHYTSSYRLDVYADGVYIKPKNGATQNDRLILQKPDKKGQYKPTKEDETGANYFDRDRRYLYVLVRGDTKEVDIKTSKQIIVDFTIPSVTEDEFFKKETFVVTLALYFNIPASKITVARAEREDSKRRKRESLTMITVTISNPPGNLTHDDPSDLTLEELQQITQKFIDAYQLNQLGPDLNLDIISLEIMEPLPDTGSEQWKVMANLKTSPAHDVQLPDYLKVVQQPEVIHEGTKFKVQPSLQLFDASHKAVAQAGSLISPWKVTAQLYTLSTEWAPMLVFNGTMTVAHNQGFFNFTDLAISHSGVYRIDFAIAEPTEANHFKISSKEFIVKERALGAGIVCQPKNVTEKEEFKVGVELIDAVTKEKINDIQWKGHNWTAEVSLYLPNTFKNGKLSGQSAPVKVCPKSGIANFTGLNIDQKGRYFLAFHYVTTPKGYDFVGGANAYLDVHPSGYKAPTIDKSHVIKLKFKDDYSTVSGNEMYFSGALHNQLWEDYPELVFSEYALSEGSIMVEFKASGKNKHLDDMLEDMWTKVKAGYKFHYNGTDFEADQVMWVNGDMYGQTLKYELHVAVIIVIIIIVLGFIFLTIGLCLYKYYYYKLELKKLELGKREPTVERRGIPYNTDDYFRVPEYKRTPSSLSGESVKNADNEDLIVSAAPKATSHFNFVKPVKHYRTATVMSQEDYPGSPAPPYESRPASTTSLQIRMEPSTLSKAD